MSKEKIIQEYINQITDQIKARQVSIDEACENLKIFCTNDEMKGFLEEAQLTLMRKQSQIKTATAVLNSRKKVYSAFAAFTKQEVLSWEEVAKRFKRKLLY